MNANESLTQYNEEQQILSRGVGLPGRVAVSFTMAGGLLLGGVLVAFQTLAGRLSGHGLFVTASGLFVVGALLGLVHGLLLGFLGRPEGQRAREAVRALGRAILYSIPAAAVAWLLTVWIALTFMAVITGRVGAEILVGVAWVGTAAVLSWAAITGVRAIRQAYLRWPDPVMGTVLVAGSFAALLVAFLADRPELWLTHFRVTEVGAVLLATFATIWIVGPAVTLSLRLVRELPGRNRTAPVSVGAGMVDVGYGLLVGLVAGLLALPFTPASVVPGTVGGFLTSMAQVLLDETLLRLFLMTAVAWVVMRRWQGARREEIAVAAVAAVAVVQVLLYLPGVVAAGFPTALAAATFTGAAILVPAILFGVVYWARGVTAALGAHGTA
ncbi:MAG TPA: hypothetical protein VLA43_06495, partial [Longimicrobiales bacterium]|nr:hypothetical protein [Longimicrobiales bacterium]